MYPIDRELFLVYIPPGPHQQTGSHIFFACVSSLSERGNMQMFQSSCIKALDAQVYRSFGVYLPGKSPVSTQGASLDTPNVWVAVGKSRIIYTMRYSHKGNPPPKPPKIGY